MIEHIDTGRNTYRLQRARGHMHSQHFMEGFDVPNVTEKRHDKITSANRSRFEDTVAESNIVRLAPLRQRIPVGGGWVRKVWAWWTENVVTLTVKRGE